MAASDMMSALMELCQEKHIDQLYLIDRLEQSLAKSYAEILHLEWGAKVTIDRTTGKIYVYRLEPIDDSMDEEGNFTEFEEIDVTPKNTSRIAAQHAKAEINAIVRNSAREQIYEEFSGRIGDLISGTVLQSTPDFTIVKIREGVEAELPHFDQRRYENERNERPMGRALPAQPAHQGRDHRRTRPQLQPGNRFAASTARSADCHLPHPPRAHASSV